MQLRKWKVPATMNNFLYRKFIRNHENLNDPEVRESYGKLAGMVGVISNVFLSVIKIFAGILTSSIAIIGDGINNLSDAASSVITLVGFRLASMPEDEEHPYGHARFEYITGLIVSIIIIFVGINLATDSIDKIMHPSPMKVTGLTIAILVIAIAVKIWQSMFNYSLGRHIDSSAIKATAADSRNDVIATSAVLASTLLMKFGNINLDGFLGLAVAAVIIISGIGLIKETSSPLLGEAPSEDLVRQIADSVLSYDHVLGIHDLVVHNYGPGKIFASLHIEMDAAMDVMESHDIVDVIEKELGEKLHIHFVAHMDPIRLDDPVIEEVKGPLQEALSAFDDVYNMHDLRCVPGPSHTNIIFDVVRAPGCTHTEKEITAYVDGKIKELNPNYNIVITFDKSYTNLL